MSILSVPNNLLSREELLLRLEEAEETLRAIRSGEVDALVVSGTQGERVFTLKDATLPYQILIEELNEGALLLSSQGTILYCNARFAEILGLPMETVLGKPFLHFVTSGDQTRARGLLEHRPEGESRGELALLGSRSDIEVGISLKEIRLDGELRLGVVVSDLTERRQAAAELRRYQEQLEERVSERTHELKAANDALRASRRAAINLMQDAVRAQEELQTTLQRFYSVLSSLHTGILLVGDDGRIEFANQAFCSLFGLEDVPADLTGLKSPEMIERIRNTYQHPDQEAARIREIIGQGQPIKGEEIALRGERTCLRDFIPIYVDGKSYGRLWHYLDITEHKQAEAALLAASLQKQAAEYSRTLIEVSLDPMVTISPEGKITDVNEATVRATGVPREELVGTDFSSYFTQPEKAQQGLRQVFAEGYATDFPLTIRHLDGHLMDVLYNASLYKEATGNTLGAFAAARDVTAQKRAEAELRRHKDNLEILVKERTAELEESARALSKSNENLEQFAYVASHDLQEPLRVMSSYSQLLERRYRGRLDKDADEFIEFIVDAAARMQKLITDLLVYSRAGRESTDMVPVDCDRLVRRLVSGMAATIESADGCVTFDSLPSVIARESSLVQLFQNLIGNALKFRGEQPPRIHVSARQADSEWIFSVRDNGMGIEPQYCERIFMIFQRLHPRDKYPGTGIGLSICRKIVENLGGRIWVESDLGQGSTFYFTLPIRKE